MIVGNWAYCDACVGIILPTHQSIAVGVHHYHVSPCAPPVVGCDPPPPDRTPAALFGMTREGEWLFIASFAGVGAAKEHARTRRNRWPHDFVRYVVTDPIGFERVGVQDV